MAAVRWHGGLFSFLVLDAFVFELVLAWLYKPVTYNAGFVTLLGVPIVIFLGWAVLLYWAVLFGRPVVAATLLTAIDLIADPLAVHLRLWTWSLPADFFGVPYSNFFAWWMYVFLVVRFARSLVTKFTWLGAAGAFFKISVIGLALGQLWLAFTS